MPFWQFFRNWLIGWIGHALSVQPFKTAHKIFFYVSIFINFFKYETIVRSSASSFGHSDPDPSCVQVLEENDKLDKNSTRNIVQDSDSHSATTVSESIPGDIKTNGNHQLKVT